jgi:hypothetical protein
MRRITYFENMRGHLNQVSPAELEAFRGYDKARKYNLDYPILSDMLFSHAVKVAEIYTSARIGKFIFATASTNSVDCMAEFFLGGYKIVDVLSMEQLLGNDSYITCCKYGLLIGRK